VNSSISDPRRLRLRKREPFILRTRRVAPPATASNASLTLAAVSSTWQESATAPARVACACGRMTKRSDTFQPR